jgi:hypothetical protein
MGIRRNLDQLSRRIYKNATPNILNARYAWAFGITEKGRKVVDGPFTVDYGSEVSQEAENALAEFPAGEIFVLKTRNMARAKSEIKAILLSRGENPDDALMRILRKKPS